MSPSGHTACGTHSVHSFAWQQDHACGNPSNACQNIVDCLHHALQDVSGGKPVQLEGTDLPIWGMEIDPEEAKEQFRAYSAKDGGKVLSQ